MRSYVVRFKDSPNSGWWWPLFGVTAENPLEAIKLAVAADSRKNAAYHFLSVTVEPVEWEIASH